MKTEVTTPSLWAELTDGILLSDTGMPILRITTDSRVNCKDALFIALVGAETDGHLYLRQAAASGAVAALVSTPPVPPIPHLSVICVSDTRLALQKAAQRWLARIRPYTIAITGSVGKTTTKELLVSTLKQSGNTAATLANYNTEIGVPLSLLAMPQTTDFFVCEMGMRARGEIAFLSELLIPNMGILTCIGTSHLETLGSRSTIAAAKLELAEHMQAGGYFFYDGDEPLIANAPILRRVRAVPVTRSRLSVLGTHNGRTSFSYCGNCYRIAANNTALLYDAALAATAALHLGLSKTEIAAGLAEWKPSHGRQTILSTVCGVTILADYYNAAPESMHAAFETLTRTEGARKIAILGGMAELGAESLELHRLLGAELAAKHIDRLWCIGDDAGELAKSAIKHGMPKEHVYIVAHPYDNKILSVEIFNSLTPGDVLLFKASRVFALEQLCAEVEILCNRRQL